MGAIEGLQVATPVFTAWVVPITVVILVGLFLIQRHGTHRVGGLFGPVMVVWFFTIAILGFHWIVRAPEVLWALDPRHGELSAVNQYRTLNSRRCETLSGEVRLTAQNCEGV